MGVAQSKNLMHELKLGGMLESYDSLLSTATKDGVGHGEFFDQLLQHEYDYREKRKVENRIRFSQLPRKACFEDFDSTANRSITKLQVKDLQSLKWLDQGRPIILIGQTGVGKTFIAEAIGMQACRHRKYVLFMDMSTLLETLALSRSQNTYLKTRSKIAKPDVLIIDDLGMRKLSATEAQDLCEILEARAYGKSTVITTQLPIDHWIEVIGDPVITDAIRDRLEHAAISITITGESYRKIKAKKLDGADQRK